MKTTPCQGKRKMTIRRTESLCPHCFKKIPAQLVAEGRDVYLEKSCPEHGSFKTIVWRGEPSLETWQRLKIPAPIHHPNTGIDKGCPFDCGICPAHRQHTCTALLEITRDCNIRCPVCFADGGKRKDAPTLETIKSWYQMLLDSGGPYNVQLSGGEPTLRDDLPEIIALGRSMGFPFIQLNTNGLRLYEEPDFLQRLAEAGLSSLFLQFDGLTGDIYEKLRGADYLEAKLGLIELCQEMGLGVILVPTVVAGVNDHQLGDIIKFALQKMPTVRGVHFQPISFFGRYPKAPDNGMRITLPEVMQKIVEQSRGRIKPANLAPPGCENSLCSFHGNFVLMPDDRLVPLTHREDQSCCCSEPLPAEVGAEKARNFVARNWQIQSDCCCEREDKAEESGTDSLAAFLERARTHKFCLSAMAFQDVWNIDLERLRDCCIHVVSPDGRRIPFCAYNLTNSQGVPLYRSRR